MEDNHELNVSGLKNTRHRKAILDVLKLCGRPLTTEEIYNEMKDNDISVNMSTVYRALKSLSDKNLITKLVLSNETKTLYEINKKKHCHYLICLGCKKIVPIERCALDKGYEKDLKKETGFTVVGHNLEIYGYCPDCEPKKDN